MEPCGASRSHRWSLYQLKLASAPRQAPPEQFMVTVAPSGTSGEGSAVIRTAEGGEVGRGAQSRAAPSPALPTATGGQWALSRWGAASPRHGVRLREGGPFQPSVL